MSMSGRRWLQLTLTNTGGSVSHTDQNGKTVTRIHIGNLEAVSFHLFGINAHTFKIWGTNEDAPADETNAIQIGSDITTNSLTAIADGPMWLFIETDIAGTGNPTGILTGRDRV